MILTARSTSLDQLIIEFNTTLDKMQWVATGYTLALATVIPLSGWAADRFGTKRIYLTAVFLFMTGSAMAGTAWSAESLILFRVLQGLDDVSWRSIFYINVPIGVLTLILGARILSMDAPRPTEKLDVLGLLVLSPGLAALIYGLAQVPSHEGFAHPRCTCPRAPARSW